MKLFFRLFTVILPLIAVLNASVTFAEDEKIIRFVEQWPFHPTKALALNTTDNLVFLVDGERLCILDYALSLQSNTPISQNANVSGMFYDQDNQRIYAASRSDGLWVMDVVDELNPAPLNYDGFRPTKTDEKGREIISEVTGVYVRDHVAYIAGGLSGVQIVDMSVPDSPEVLAWITPTGALLGYIYSVDTVVSGNFLYVGDLVNGVYIYDISNLRTPEFVGVIVLPNARDLTISGNLLFVAMEGNGLQVIDITDPRNPKERGFYKTAGRERSVVVDGNMVYVGYNEAGVQVLDISAMTPDEQPYHNPDWEYTETGAKSMALDPLGNALFITDDVVGLQKINVSDPAAMVQQESFDTPADATALFIDGDYAYVLDNDAGADPGKEGLRIFKLTPGNNNLQFNLVGFHETPGSAQDVFVKDNLAYVADGTNGLFIINVANKKNPVSAGFAADTPGFAQAVCAAGNYAYIADGTGGFADGTGSIAVIDISNPGIPKPFSTVLTSSPAKDVQVSGSHLYVALADSGMAIYDISSPGNPQLNGSFDTEGDAQGIAVSGDLALVADGGKGISIINIKDKFRPELLGSFSTAGYAYKVSFAGDYAYVADGENGITAIDLTDPAAPILVPEWSFNSTGNTTDITSSYTANDELFVIAADGPSGIIAVNPTFNEDYSYGGGGSSGGCFIDAAWGK